MYEVICNIIGPALYILVGLCIVQSLWKDLHNKGENNKEEKKNMEQEELIIALSPEDFERFQKGEITKEELLGIMKMADKAKEKYNKGRKEYDVF